MLVGNFPQNFANDQVLAVVNGEVGVVAVVRIHLLVHRQRQLEHFGADRAAVRSSASASTCSGVDVCFHHQPEFRIVELFAQPPS